MNGENLKVLYCGYKTVSESVRNLTVCVQVFSSLQTTELSYKKEM